MKLDGADLDAELFGGLLLGEAFLPVEVEHATLAPRESLAGDVADAVEVVGADLSDRDRVGRNATAASVARGVELELEHRASRPVVLADRVDAALLRDGVEPGVELGALRIETSAELPCGHEDLGGHGLGVLMGTLGPEHGRQPNERLAVDDPGVALVDRVERAVVALSVAADHRRGYVLWIVHC